MVAVDVFRHRELKWVEMLQNWDKWMSKKFPKVRFLLIIIDICFPLLKTTPLYSPFFMNCRTDLGSNITLRKCFNY